MSYESNARPYETPTDYASLILSIYNFMKIHGIPSIETRNKIYKNFRGRAGISVEDCSDECFYEGLNRVVEHLFPGTTASNAEQAWRLGRYNGTGAGTRSKKPRRKTHNRRSKKSRRSRRIRRR